MLTKNPWWRPERRRAGLPGIVLAIALVASIAVIALFHRAFEDRDRARFYNAVQSTTDRIHNRIDAYVSVLVSTRGLFLANGPGVDAAQFERFVAVHELQRRYPGIQGVGFTQRLTAAERPALEARRRREGIADFTVWPSEPRAELHSIVYLEPLDRRNRAALGYDMFTEPTRRAAMERARDSGLAAATGGVTLVQEIDPLKQHGFLLYLPLYAGGATPATVEERRRALVGFVYAPFRVDDFLAGIFGSERDHRVTFTIRDGGETLHVPADAPAEPRFTHASTLEVAGRTWALTFESLPSFEAGSSRWVLPYTIAGAALVCALLLLLSLSQSRAHEQFRVHSRILDSMTEGVSVADEHGTILYTNPAEDRIFGYARGELIGKPVTVQNTYADDENARIVGEVIEQLRQRGAWTGEFSNVRKDGTAFTTFARISALELAGTSYWVCVQEDITDRKRAEAERDAMLVREQALRRQAEAASRAKDELVALVSHELRNPMAPIATAIELIADRCGAAVEREVAIANRQLRTLRRLVDDLVDVSAVTRGELALARRPVELATLVRDAMARAAPDLAGRERDVAIDVPASGLVVDADAERLAQVVVNLLRNAAKYSEAGTPIDVVARAQDGEITLRVRDRGAGMTPDVLARLFEPFTQGERRVERSFGGLGLGLAIVRSFVEAHGGRVEAHSEGRGTGSELVVRLPASTAELPPAEAPPQVAAPKRVLVVDDNADAADLLVELLQMAGYDVRVAYDPQRAIELAEEAPVDVAILDIGLPDMDGYELASRLPNHPVRIALTGYGHANDRERSRQAGFAHHFTKPVSPGKLLDVLAGLTPPTA